jgi:hypothetical protein
MTPRVKRLGYEVIAYSNSGSRTDRLMPYNDLKTCPIRYDRRHVAPSRIADLNRIAPPPASCGFYFSSRTVGHNRE